MEDLRWAHNTLYQYLDSGATQFPTRAICRVVHVPSNVPFGDGYWMVNFVLPVDDRYSHYPFPSLEEAKAAALAIWRLK